MESSRQSILVNSSQVESSRAEMSQVEWSRVESIQVELSHGVELSGVESTVDSS